MFQINKQQLTQDADRLLKTLFPICRSITGNGLRKTLDILGDYAPLTRVKIASGTPCFDWEIPLEWNIRDAFISVEGKRIVDFRENNVHVVSYSEPVNKRMNWSELEPRLHSLPHLPDAIPYRTSYYNRTWGFCLTHKQLEEMKRKYSSKQFTVVIDSSLKKGYLDYAEATVKGRSKNEILISTYCCHPSLANDNLSGAVATALLLSILRRKKSLNNTYRFLFAPETIGVLAFLKKNRDAVKRNVKGAFVVTCVGGPGAPGIKYSFRGDSIMDRAADIAFREAGKTPKKYPFVPDGSDERQYSSLGFRIPCVTISKDKYYEYDYYHTSLDNLDFVKPEYILETVDLYLKALGVLERNAIYRNTIPFGEVRLGKRGLYPSIGGGVKQGAVKNRQETELDALTWTLFLADGNTDLHSIAERSGMPFEEIESAVKKLLKERVLEKS